jgi:feruloyl esterase
MKRAMKSMFIAAVLGTAAVLPAYGAGDGSPQTHEGWAKQDRCTERIVEKAFKHDDLTTILLVKSFEAGDPIALAATPATPAPPIAPHDLCLVKLVVGPGNPGPANAPSTTPGIGIEVWLPSSTVWDNRLQLVGTPGDGGLPNIQNPGLVGSVPAMTRAMIEKTVSAQTDHAHGFQGGATGSFEMNFDGGINTMGWNAVGHAAVHEMAVKVKALVKGFYGQDAAYSYLMGCSGGGHDGYASAAYHPEDFNGILAGAPAVNWTQFLGGADMYPQIVYQRDLGGTALTPAQRASVSAAAVSACDANLTGQHDGYITDLQQCRYDPTKDATVLCVGSGGTNSTASCLTTVQAKAVNKIWYGMTADGSVPDPQADVGINAFTAPNQLWWGMNRGTDLTWVASAPEGPNVEPPFFGPFPIWMGANIMEDPRYGLPQFLNPTGNGQNLWKTLTYQQFADLFYRGYHMDPLFGKVTTSPDLTGFKNAGGKLLSWQGLADAAIPVGGTINYYERSMALTGGFVETQQFHRFFLIPGVAHCAGFGMNGVSGVSPAAAAKTPYFKTNPIGLGGTLAPQDWFQALKDWVENGKAPDAMELVSADGTNSRPACPYPKKLTYLGGNPNAFASYTCL